MKGGRFGVVFVRAILMKESREEKEKNKKMKNEALEEEDGTTQKPRKQRVRKRRTKNIKCRNINSPRTVIACYEHQNHKARAVMD